MKTFTIVAAMSCCLGAIASSTSAAVRLEGGGATFPASLYTLWFQEYHKQHPDVTIEYKPIGSGGGIRGITARTLDFGATDAPMSHREMERAGGEEGLVEIPMVAGAVVLAFNIPGLGADLQLDGPTISEIYLGHIKSWNDARLAAINPGVRLPDLPITPVYRSDSSGTNYIFAHYLCGQSDDFYSRIGAAKRVAWPAGIGAAGGKGVAQLISATRGAIGYIDLADAVETRLAHALLKNRSGKFVKATSKAISAAAEAAATKLSGDIVSANIWDQSGEDVYPIASFTYIVLYKDLSYFGDPAKGRAMADFFRWATTDGQAFAPALHFAPFGPGVKKAVGAALNDLIASPTAPR